MSFISTNNPSLETFNSEIVSFLKNLQLKMIRCHYSLLRIGATNVRYRYSQLRIGAMNVRYPNSLLRIGAKNVRYPNSLLRIASNEIFSYNPSNYPSKPFNFA